MSASREEIDLAFDTIRGDFARLRTHLDELQRQVLTLPIPTERQSFPCPECGIVRPTAPALADHRELVHGIEGVAPGV